MNLKSEIGLLSLFFSFLHRTYVEVLEDSEHRDEEDTFHALTEISLVEKIKPMSHFQYYTVYTQ